MIRIATFAVVTTFTLALTGCGAVSVASKPNQKISRSAKITVVTPSSDPQNVSGQIEHLLLTQGFEVTSEVVGNSQVEYKEAEATQPGSRMASSVLTTVRRLPTELVLRFSYNSYFDVFYWSFTRFNGTVVDLETGSVVASVSFSGDRSISSVLSDFSKQLGSMAE